MRDELTQLFFEAEDFLEADDLPRAIKTYKAALKLAKKNDAEEFFAHSNLGLAYYNFDDERNAIDCFQKSQQVVLKLYGSNSSPYAVALSNEAMVLLYSDNLPRAELLLDEAMKLLHEAEPLPPSDMHDFICANSVDVFSTAAECKARLGNAGETIEILRQACEYAKSKFGETDARTIQSTVELALVLDSNGFKKEAKLLKKFVSNTFKQNLITADLMIAYDDGQTNGLLIVKALRDSTSILRKKNSTSNKSAQSRSSSAHSVQSVSIIPEQAKTKKAKNSTEGYQIKITLKYTEPAVWRRVVVPADMPLSRLHKLIQRAMGWSDDHLHQFLIRKETFGDSRQMEINDERVFDLIDFEFKVGSKFEYEYDFGDAWLHSIEIEKKLNKAEYEASSIFLDGNGACPPEDCGGIPAGVDGRLRS